MNKNRLISYMIILIMISNICIGCSKDTSKDITQIELEDGQTMIIGQVSSIKGNELELALANEVDSSSFQKGSSDRQSRRESSDGTTDSKQGGMPADMPSGMSNNADKSKRQDMQQGDKSQGNQQNSMQKSASMYTLTGDSKTVSIPVGTKVITMLGAVTTFSRIAAEDTLKIVTEKNDAGDDVIVGVWIVA